MLKMIMSLIIFVILPLPVWALKFEVQVIDQSNNSVSSQYSSILRRELEKISDVEINRSKEYGIYSFVLNIKSFELDDGQIATYLSLSTRFAISECFSEIEKLTDFDTMIKIIDLVKVDLLNSDTQSEIYWYMWVSSKKDIEQNCREFVTSIDSKFFETARKSWAELEKKAEIKKDTTQDTKKK